MFGVSSSSCIIALVIGSVRDESPVSFFSPSGAGAGDIRAWNRRVHVAGNESGEFIVELSKIRQSGFGKLTTGFG